MTRKYIKECIAKAKKDIKEAKVFGDDTWVFESAIKELEEELNWVSA